MEISTWIISVLSVIGGASLTLITTLIVNQVSYKNEYYKMIIEKRIKAYNNIEHLINTVNNIGWERISESIVKNDTRQLQPIRDEIDLAKSDSIWLSREMKSALIYLNWLLSSFEMENFPKVDIKKGINLRNNITETVTNIEQILKSDMLSLHKVGDFLVNK